MEAYSAEPDSHAAVSSVDPLRGGPVRSCCVTVAVPADDAAPDQAVHDDREKEAEHGCERSASTDRVLPCPDEGSLRNLAEEGERTN